MIYPSLASVWVAGAALTAVSVADLAWDGGVWGRDFPVVSALLEVSVIAVLLGFVLNLVALLLVLPLAVRLLAALASADNSKISVWSMLRRQISGLPLGRMLREPAALGLLATLPFLVLIVVDSIVMTVLSPAKGSQAYRIGSVVIDVGVVGFMPIVCLVTIPILVLKLWRTWPGGQGDAPADSIV
ncbi:hypothetical protein U9M48_038965 [Paspalum notatum var. saurae]|uniref:Uncharacterized protein n=1 Tax=Paspalum notatum var. saurae TaxID=547442 RepID=A0AAQ3XC66_PASNO